MTNFRAQNKGSALTKIKFIIGITGGSGVGKTTLIRKLYEEFEGRVSTLSLDNYYLPKESQEKDENGIVNFDLPTALDCDSLRRDLDSLIEGDAVRYEVYRFNNPQADREFRHVEPKDLLIVEGLFVMHYGFVSERLNYSVFLSVYPEIQLQRRLVRDMNERNYTKEDILYQWDNHVVPSFRNYVQPYMEQADLIIENNTHFDENIHILTSVIHKNIDTGE